MSRSELRGVISALHTPFTSSYDIDEEGFKANIHYLIGEGVYGLMVAGTCGEFYALSLAERKRLVEVAVDEANGEVLIIPHTGHSSTEIVIELTRHAKDVGADAVLIVSPPFLRPTQQELCSHFESVAEAVDTPIIVYNNPSRAGVNIEPQTIIELAGRENIVALKDSGRNLRQTMEVILGAGDKLTVLSGETDLFLPTLALGGKGGILATSLVAPDLCLKIYDAYIKGKLDRAQEAHYRLLPLLGALGKEGKLHAALKAAVEMLGRPAGPMRRPKEALSEEGKSHLREALKALDLL